MASHEIRSSLTAAALATAIVALGAPSAGAETRTIRIAKQFGISYLPLTVMEEKKLLEERDPDVRRRNLDQIRKTAADPELSYKYLLDSAMISSLRRSGMIR